MYPGTAGARIVREELHAMTILIPEKHIAEAIARLEARRKKSAARSDVGPRPQIITLSRDYGTEGRVIGEMVAKKLGFSFWDREILDVLAGQSGWKLQARMFEALDEKAQGAIDAIVADFFGGLEKHNYFHLLPKAIFTIAQEDAVIVGRGAHLILPDVFRVKIEASLATRVQAVAALEGMPEKTARQKVRRIDKERAGFIRELGSIIAVGTDMIEYDLRINTDHISSKNAAQTIIDAFERTLKDRK
ncbi:MAG: cytidylate kinase-like family protein [Deltaproteobacteria bacterium]|nr:cytidylate kinase-like family protein [Deltaproteobacteria bacterium]